MKAHKKEGKREREQKEKGRSAWRWEKETKVREIYTKKGCR